MSIRRLKDLFWWYWAPIEYHLVDGWTGVKFVFMQLLIPIMLLAILMFNGIGFIKKGFYLL